MPSLFGSAEPQAEVRKARSDLRREARVIDRDVRQIQRDEAKVKQSIKDAAKRGDMQACRTLAKEVVRSRSTTNRLHTTKAHMNSTVAHMQTQAAQQKVTRHMQKTTEVMRRMNKQTNVQQISATMQAMQQETAKAETMAEMVDDAMEALDDDDASSAADDEVARVMEELDLERFMTTKAVPTTKPVAQEEDEAADAAAEAAMLQRLADLKAPQVSR